MFFHREDFGFSVKVFDRCHSDVTGGGPQGCVLGHLYAFPVCVSKVGGPDGAAIVVDRFTDGFVRTYDGFFVFSP